MLCLLAATWSWLAAAERRADRDHLRERRCRLRRQLAAGDAGSDAVEVPFEAGRRDHQQRTCRRAAEVGVGVGHTARGEGKLAGAAGEDVAGEPEGELA